MFEAFVCQLTLDLFFVGAFAVLHRRTRRMQRLMSNHMNADYEHLQVTDELMQRVADLDGKGLPKAVREQA